MKTKKRGFDWIIELRKAVRKQPSETKFKQLTKKSKHWPTCACGQLCKKLPRLGDMGIQPNAPADDQLRSYGIMFSAQVLAGKWKEALQLFHSIEKRTLYLLANQEKEQNAPLNRP